jgi:DNA-binding transcriptional MerR regulator
VPEESPSDAQLVTTTVAANAVGVNPRSLTRWVKSGAIKPTIRTPGGHLKWDIEDLRKQLRVIGALR